MKILKCHCGLIEAEINIDKKWHYSDKVYDTFDDADAAIFLTEWSEFQNLNWPKIAKKHRKTYTNL